MGWFTTAGGVTANCIARWDGTAWHPVGSGMNGGVRALAFGPDRSLYAGGEFTTAGGVTANGIARWDGAAWHPLGSGIEGDPYPGVYALAVGSDNSLYAGGYFTTAGGVATDYVARWDGTAWRPLGSGMDKRVSALAMDELDNVYAGGKFTTAGNVAANAIARWEGAAWHPLAAG